MTNKKIRVLDFFCGIGAFDCALDRLGVDYELVDAVDIDKYAVQSFNAIHGTSFEPQDITKWDKDVGEIDIMWQSSPCQDISLAGRQAGADKGSSTRSGLVWEVLRIVEKVKPKVVIWENVKGLTTKKHKHVLEEYITDLEKLGYNSYWQVLNSKNYGVPQNRERVYTVSVRKDVDSGYEFPIPIPLTKRLKDVLETNVDEKYYLSEDRLTKIKLWDARQRENGRGFRFQTKTGEDVSRAITTGDDRPAETTYVEEKPVRLGGMYDKDGERHQAGSIFDSQGISPTLDTCSGGNRTPYTNEPSLDFVGGFGETDRVGDDKHLSRNYPQGNRAYSTDGLASAQTANGGGLGGKTGLYLEEPYAVASRGRGEKGNTSQHLGPRADGVTNTITSVQKDNYVAEPQAIKRRRTEYGKEMRKAYENHEVEADETMRESYIAKDGVMPTLTASGREQKIAEPVCLTPNNYSHKAGDGMATRKRTVSELSGTIAARPGGNGEMLVGEPVVYDDYNSKVKTDQSTACTLTTNCGSSTPRNGQKIIEPRASALRIRKLTALECWRLQGFDDAAHAKAEQAGVSASQRYKQAGNSVTVNVIVALLSQLGLNGKKWNGLTIEERERLAQATMVK